MKYRADDKNYSSIAKMLPAEAMAAWCEAANEAADMALDHNACIMAGWDAVKKGWERPDGGKKWVKKGGTDLAALGFKIDTSSLKEASRALNEFAAALKDNPDSGDVHVDGVMGADGKKKKPVPYTEGDAAKKFQTAAQVCKVDSNLGIVFGFAIVCKKDGEDYYDLQDDNIPEDAMLKAASEFMLESRVAGDMHGRDESGAAVKAGDIVFAFPLTSDIAKALDIQTKQTGLLIGYKPEDASILGKFADGTYTGFSIGGERVKDEAVD